MIALDLQLLILSYVGFGDFITFYKYKSLEIKISKCYRNLPHIYKIIEYGDLIGTAYLLDHGIYTTKYLLVKSIQFGHLHILKYILNFFNLGADDYKIIKHSIKFEKIQILNYLICKYNYVFQDHEFSYVAKTKNLDLIKFTISKYPQRFDWIAELVMYEGGMDLLQVFEYAVSVGIKFTDYELAVAEGHNYTEIVEYIKLHMMEV